MGLSFLTPLFLAGLLAISVPIFIHLIRRHQGKKLDFPSLMFLRQLPVRSVKRLRVRDWPLLLLRAAALALIVLAFARPVLQIGAQEEGVGGDGLREVVVVLDRSWSMTRGDRWDDALGEARDVLNGLVAPDRVALVVFDASGRVVVEPTLEPGRVAAALDTIRAGWGGTQVGAGLQAARGILEASERSRREVVLISDFQLRGWEEGVHEQLPAGTTLVPVDVGDDGIGSLIVSDVTLEHSFFEGRQRVHPQVRIIRSGAEAPSQARVALEMDGREVESRTVELPTEGAVAVAFEPITLPDAGVRGAVRLEPQGAAAEEPFRFFFSPQQVLSILLVEGANAGNNPYLRSALSIGGGQAVQVRTRTGGQVSATDLQGIDVAVFSDVPLPSGASGSLLRAFIRQGGGLVIATGAASTPATWEADWDEFLPGELGMPVDRNPLRGGTLTGVDRDHPIFSPFTALAGSGLGGPRFYRYRTLVLPPAAPAQPTPGGGVEEGARPDVPLVIARFDDGAPALAERTVGLGHVLVWTSTLDNSWTDFPIHPVFLPVVQEMARYAASEREAEPYFTVGQPLDAEFLLTEAGAPAPIARPGEAPVPAPLAILVDPDGVGAELGGEAGDLVQLPVPGFYEVRLGEDGADGTRTFAANPDVAEADPTRIDPQELILAVAPGSGSGGEGGEPADDALGNAAAAATLLQEGERRQGAWRFFLLGAVLLLVSEALVASRTRPLNRALLEE